MLQIIDPSMLGRIMNDVQSYDFKTNEKYKRIETLIGIMKETFGSEVEELMKQKAEEEEAAMQAALAAKELEEFERDSAHGSHYPRAIEHRQTLQLPDAARERENRTRIGSAQSRESNLSNQSDRLSNHTRRQRKAARREMELAEK